MGSSDGVRWMPAAGASGSGESLLVFISRDDQKILRFTQIYSDPVRFGQTQRCAKRMELLVARVAGGALVDVSRGGVGLRPGFFREWLVVYHGAL